MKNLLFFLIIAAAVGLFFHDKQQTADLTGAQADLAKAQADNASYQQQIAGLKAQVQQLSQAAPVSRLSQPSTSAGPQNQGAWGLQGSGALDRPAYKN